MTLPETATTGYRWQASLDDDLLQQIGDEAGAPTLPRGAPGWRAIAFRARSPGQTELRLVSRRSWEQPSVEPADRFTVHLEIAPDE